MKIAFSTLGCPEWTLEEIIEAAKRDRFDGIEFRGLLSEIDLVNAPEFSPARIAETRTRLEDAGVGVSCLSSSVVVVASTGTEVDRREAIAHAKRYIDLAKEVGARCVRLFGGNVPATLLPSEAYDRAAGSLRDIGDYAQERGVIAAVETHDALIQSDRLMNLIRLADHPAVRVLWDIHHPYRIAGESIAYTVNQLGNHVAATHLKDSVLSAEGEGYTYTLLGHGDVPLQAALHALKEMGYDGYLTLEWEKRWIPAMERPEIAFPQYARQVREWLADI